MSLVGIGTPPPPLSPASVPLPPNQRGKGTLATRLRARGGGVIPTTGEKAKHSAYSVYLRNFVPSFPLWRTIKWSRKVNKIYVISTLDEFPSVLKINILSMLDSCCI